MSSEKPKPAKPERQTKTTIVLLAIGITLLFGIIFSQAAFNLTFLRPNTNQQAFVFAALSTLIFLLLLTLTFVLVRTLLKLYAERQSGKLGSKFRTRMVLGALLLSFGPVIFLFLFAYGLMNRSIDKWFSRPVELVRQDTAAVASLLTHYAARDAREEATAMAASPETQRAFLTGDFSGAMNEFRRHEATLQGGFAFAIVDNDHAEASYRAPDVWHVLKPLIEPNLRTGEHPHPVSIKGREYMIGSAPVGSRGRVVVGLPLPPTFTSTLQQLEKSEQRYFDLSQQRKVVRRTYMGLLLLLTVLVLFAATWFALFLAKLVTRPVEALANATQEISRGRLDHRVQVPATDELGQLVQSFNRMAAELEASRSQIEASSRSLAQANSALEQRRQHMETILESIPTGVLSLDANWRITHTNTALRRMFRSQGTGPNKVQVGCLFSECFASDIVEDIERMLRKSDRMGTVSNQMEITVQQRKLDVAITASSLHVDRRRLGYVVVFEDLSDLLMAQKQAAWREVARRVAHEIKNPLTPIALSAERIKRHLERGSAPDDVSLAVIHTCADTIGSAVETVRTLVNEFSMLARFPAAQPQASDINAIIESALALFDGRLEGVRIVTVLAPDLPRVMADPEAIKRAIANLVDNAAEAMHDSLVREVRITTALLPARELVEIVVADTGHGVTHEVKEKLFLPYFSTKKRGTGLGLSIVSRIIEDHQGTIRVEENQPVGARFIVELPIAPDNAGAVDMREASVQSGSAKTNA
ncbi:MAG TPA: ATP-binding protein [Terriglobales bacterium]|nr:ATP-binding protein [Terriglobales bacterium]